MNTKITKRKQRILDVARESFYLRGYDETTFELVAAQAETSTSLIRYHFEDKASLAQQVYIHCLYELRDTYQEKAERLYPGVPFQVLSVAFSFALMDYFRADRNALSFYFDTCANMLDRIDSVLYSTYEEVLSKSQTDSVEPTQVQLSTIVSSFATVGLTKAFAEKTVDLDDESFFHYYFKINMLPFDLSEAEADTLFREAFSLYKKVYVAYLPNFCWE